MKIGFELRISAKELCALGCLVKVAQPRGLSDMLCHIIDEAAAANVESGDSVGSDDDKPAREQSSCDDKSLCDDAVLPHPVC